MGSTPRVPQWAGVSSGSLVGRAYRRRVAGTGDHERVRRDIVRLVHRSVGVPQLVRDVTRVLRRAVPFDGTCLLTMDPATLLPTGDFVENGLPRSTTVRLIEIELREPDINKFTALARGRRPAAGLAEATAGELDRSLRHRELRRPSGFGDELRVVLTGAAGTWGALTLLREDRRPRFTEAETRLMASLSAPLADGVRRATLLGAAAAGGDTRRRAAGARPRPRDRAGQPGSGPLARRAGQPTERLPVAVRSVAVRAREVANGEAADGSSARARVRTPAGRWVDRAGLAAGRRPGRPRGRPAGGGPRAGARAADRRRLRPHATGSAGSSSWWRRGFATSDIGARLHLSAYTVQDHLKSIFDKTGTGTRGELVARLFFDHYAPRLRDST